LILITSKRQFESSHFTVDDKSWIRKFPDEIKIILKIRENFHFHARLRLNVSDGEIYALTRFFFELGMGLKLGFSLQFSSFLLWD
jgi:hypothetical protein